MENHAWQLSNLQLSKRLKELGVKQESLWWWVDGIEDNFSEIKTVPREIKLYSDDDLCSQFQKVFNKYSAFTVAELGEMLPSGLKINNRSCAILAGKMEKGTRFIGAYSSGEQTELEFPADTEANARAKCLIYLKEKGLIK